MDFSAIREWWVTAGVIVLVLLIGGGTTLAVFGPGWMRHRQEERIRLTGAPAVARVIGLEDTGNRFNATPEIIIRLEVRAEGRPPWQASVTRILSIAEFQAYAPGREISVRYDPARPERVAIAP